MMAKKFTPDRRERLLTLLETGRTIGEAVADVGVCRATVATWVEKGRRGVPGAVEFALRFDAVKEGTAETPMTERDLRRCLERAVRNGSVRAMDLLWKLMQAERQPPAAGVPADPFDELAAATGPVDLAARRRRRRDGAA